MSDKRRARLEADGSFQPGSTFARPASAPTPSPRKIWRSLGVRPEARTREPAKSAPRKVRDTGPSRETRGMVLARDNFQCIACGKPVGDACTWWSIQHRVARGQGGTNDLFNLIALCGSATTGCHGLCESRDREMQARGYWLESWQDPSREPVMVTGEDGGVTVWLSVDGEYLLEMPGDVA